MDLSHPSARLIVSECQKEGLLRNQCAYVLSTAWHESGAFRYTREIWGPTAAQKRYEGRKDLGNTIAGDGKKFMGRGFSMITGRRNYTDWANRTGLDLVNHPELAEQPAIAARILVTGMRIGTFTGKALLDYITLSKSDFIGARRIINGTDRASLIAGYAKDFDALLKAEGYGVAKPVSGPPPLGTPIPGAKPYPKPEQAPATPPATKNTFIALLIDLLAFVVRLFKGEQK